MFCDPFTEPEKGNAIHQLGVRAVDGGGLPANDAPQGRKAERGLCNGAIGAVLRIDRGWAGLDLVS